MRSNRLGCLSATGILAALITALVIAGYAYASGGLMYNPGPLNAQSGRMLGGVTSHAEIGGNCEACHSAPWEAAVMADRCAACHIDIAVQMRDVASVHGAMTHDNPNLGCRHCHPDHRGQDARLTELGDASFPHEVVGYSLNGHQLTAARAAFVCDDCHHGDITTFASDSCQTCHRQIDVSFTQAHLLAFGADCLACHDGVDRYGDDFNHVRFDFQLTGKHADAICTECHLDARTIADLQSAPQNCLSCHQQDDSHEGRFGSVCAECHSTDGWSPARFDHNLSVFKLEGEHAEVSCESCHQDRVYQGTPMDCFSCHQQDDEHEGQYGTDCSACHNPSDWDDADFDHNLTKFPLTGGHANVACERCHANYQFAGLSTSCGNCHGDPAYHAGLFGLNCLQCHTVNNWSARYQGPHPSISRNHEGASCRDCHTKTLHTATCRKCHDSNNPRDDDGGKKDD